MYINRIAYKKSSFDYWKYLKVETTIYVGVQGPLAFGGQTQNFMHSLFLENNDFNGWNNQINNGLIFDMELGFYKGLPLRGDIYETNFFGKAHFGTLHNFLLSGIQFRIGRYKSSFSNKYLEKPFAFQKNR